MIKPTQSKILTKQQLKLINHYKYEVLYQKFWVSAPAMSKSVGFFNHHSILNLNDIKMARQNQTMLSLFLKKICRISNSDWAIFTF